MKISQIFEEQSKKLVVVYGGRFQPFHLGHYKSYKWLCKKFGTDNVWIATSNKTNFNSEKGKVSPLTYKEKKELIVGMYKIPERRVINCKNPAFAPEEVLAQFKDQVTYVAAVGDKDGERYSSGSYKRLPENFSERSLKDGPYFIEIPRMKGGMSGTELRNQIKAASDEEMEKLFKKYFGAYDSMVARLLKLRFGEIK